MMDSNYMRDAIMKRRRSLSGDLPMEEEGQELRQQNEELMESGLAPTVRDQGKRMEGSMPGSMERMADRDAVTQDDIQMDSNEGMLRASNENRNPSLMTEESVTQAKNVSGGNNDMKQRVLDSLYDDDDLGKPGLKGKLAARMKQDVEKKNNRS